MTNRTQPIPLTTNQAASRTSEGGGNWRVLALLCAAQFVTVLTFQAVAITLPAIGRGLGASVTGLQWVVTAHALTLGGFLLLSGRAADLFGHRRLFLAGLGLFVAASLGCGLAPTVSVLIVARAVQGLGAALFTPAVLALLTDAFPEGPARTRALGLWGAAGPIGGIVSVVGSGLLAGPLGWRGIFVLAALLAAVPLLAARVVLPKGPEQKRERSAGQLDLSGAVVQTGGVVLFVAGLSRATRSGGGWLPLGLLAAGVVLLIGFVAIERRVAAPLMPPRLFRCRSLLGANLVALLHGASTNTPVVFFTLYLQEIRGESPLRTGIAFLPCNLGVIAGMTLGARLAARAGFRTTMALGMGIVVTGLPLMTRISLDRGYLETLLPGLILWGLGLGIAQIGSVGAATAGLEPAERGIAAGLVNTAAQLGTAIGLAIIVGIATIRTDALAGSNAPTPNELIAGFRAGWLGAATLAAIGAIIALTVRDRRPQPNTRLT